MNLRDTARKLNDHGKFEYLRNKANKLVKRDKILSVLKRLNGNPGPRQTWQEAKSILGKGPGANKLPLVTTNINPAETADTQNMFFIEKISKLVKGIQKLKCNTCDKNFIQKRNLNSHIRKVYEVEVPFECEVCESTFTSNVSLNAHITSVHVGMESHKCDSCDAVFIQTSGLNEHKSIIHEGNKVPSTQPVKEKFEFKYATRKSVTKIIKRLKNTSSLGVDMIPTRAWKLGVEILAAPITKLINLSLSSGKVPKLFKSALVHPVHKGSGKDPRQPSLYQPISILCSLSKVLETVVRNSLLEWLEAHNYLPDAQNGFRPKRSVAMALSCAQAEWVAAKNRNEYVAILGFDFSAAFDTISIGPLSQKLINA